MGKEQQQVQPIPPKRDAAKMSDAELGEHARKAGMRFEFAKSALIGLCNNPHVFREQTHEYFARQVWAIADAMVSTEFVKEEEAVEA